MVVEGDGVATGTEVVDRAARVVSVEGIPSESSSRTSAGFSDSRFVPKVAFGDLVIFVEVARIGNGEHHVLPVFQLTDCGYDNIITEFWWFYLPGDVYDDAAWTKQQDLPEGSALTVPEAA